MRKAIYLRLTRFSLSTMFDFSCSIFHYWLSSNVVKGMNNDPWLHGVLLWWVLPSHGVTCQGGLRESCLLYLNFTLYNFALIAPHTFGSQLSFALFCFLKFKDIVDVVDGIFQEFSLPTFYKVHVHCTSENHGSFSVICF